MRKRNAGISKAFKLLLNEVNIPCEVVVGYHQGDYHAWNLVKLGTEWYYADATSDLGQSTYTAFLKCQNDFSDYQISE